VREHRARIVRHIVDEDGAGAAFGAVASQLGAGEPELVAQRPRQRFLLHHVDASLAAIDRDGDQPSAAGDRALPEQGGGAEEIIRGGNACSTRDNGLYEGASRHRPLCTLESLVCHYASREYRWQCPRHPRRRGSVGNAGCAHITCTRRHTSVHSFEKSNCDRCSRSIAYETVNVCTQICVSMLIVRGAE